MSLPAEKKQSLTPSELSFIATSETVIEIVPNFSMGQIRLLSGIWGPFRPPSKSRVPLWLALDLKRRKRCSIVAPEWLTVDSLQERLKEETSNGQYADMPFRYLETAKAIIEVAGDDLDNAALIRSLLMDIRQARQTKSREGVIKMNDTGMAMTGISQLEINELRPFFVESFGVMRRLGGAHIPATLSQSQIPRSQFTLDEDGWDMS
ncbi:DNA replication complex GINS protein psf2 [Wallemia mellicola]|nr:DNA replication complex GINS protein psf2 [Wallemia mellicola]TIC72072.1 DNA replication complex GINS protein psf2 [Wallemia mellicola]